MKLFLLLFFFAAGEVFAQSVTRVDTVPAPSLKVNSYGDPAWREAGIYLPPGYAAHPEKRFPVVYILHGFGGGYEPFLRRIAFQKPLDSLIARGALREMIVVAPDANNRLTGGFFRNSPVAGNWEDFVVKDLVGYVDSHYRTIRSKKGRGIAGWSMGGYGALYMAARNSKIFSAVYALSPCCLMPDLPADTLWRVSGRAALKAEAAGKVTTNFNVNLVTALGAIYTPAPGKPPFFVRFPWEGPSAAVADSIAELWRDTPLEIIRKTSPSVLKTVIWAFDAGDRDAFPDIPRTTKELSAVLTHKGVGNSFEIFKGTHGDKIRERIETRVLPFFSRVFSK